MNKLLSIVFILIGLGVGFFLPQLAENFSFLGKLFLNFLKLLIIPIVFTSLFLAIINLDRHELKRLGGFTFLYYGLTSLVACFTGLAVSNFFLVETDSSLSFPQVSEGVRIPEFSELILSFIPQNIFAAASSGNIIQIVTLAIFLGICSLFLADKSKSRLRELAVSFNDLLDIAIKGVLYIAPIGIASLLASLVANFEKGLFLKLADLFIAISIAAAFHLFITLPLFGRIFGKFSPYLFIWKMRKVLGLAFVSASSSATLPISIKELEAKSSVSAKTSRFVLPLGATLNMDGSALYQSLVLFFMAGFAGVDLSFSSQIMIAFTVMLSSAGTAGIPAGGIVMMTAVMEMVGIPLEYLGIYVLVDRFWDYPITMLNVSGDLFAARTLDRYID